MVSSTPGPHFTPEKDPVLILQEAPEVPREFQEVKVPRLRDNGPGWWQGIKFYYAYKMPHPTLTAHH